jgi:hypothetical protein
VAIVMAGRCRDCRWWEDFQGDPSLSMEAADRGSAGFCERIVVKVVQGNGQRDDANIVAIFDPDGAEKQLSGGVEDDTICSIHLSTGPDFGCIAFEARS